MIFFSCFRVMVVNRLHSKQGYKGTTIFQKQREANASTHKNNLKRDKDNYIHIKTRETQTTCSTTASPSIIVK